MRHKYHVAVYGKVAIPRKFCEDCQTFAFVFDDIIQCCDKHIGGSKPRAVKRMSDIATGRKGPGRNAAKKILEEQDGRCLYCERRIGSYMIRHHKMIRLRLNWDHMVPYVYSLDSRPKNFAAACHVCNGIKSDKMFASVEEVKVYVQEKIKAKGYEDLSEVSS